METEEIRLLIQNKTGLYSTNELQKLTELSRGAVRFILSNYYSGKLKEAGKKVWIPQDVAIEIVQFSHKLKTAMEEKQIPSKHEDAYFYLEREMREEFFSKPHRNSLDHIVIQDEM